MRSLIIVNNVAAKARKAWPIIEKQLKEAKLDYEVYETNAKGDATQKTRAALREGITTIAVVGGDGTLSEVAEGFFELAEDLDSIPRSLNPNARLAVFPAGTGDDFARGMRGKRVSLQHWIDSFLAREQQTKNVDVLYGRCDGFQRPFICLNASTMGIGGETAARVAAQGKFMRNFSGEFRFLYAALGALAVWRERRVRVTVDGKVFADGPMNLVGVASGLYAGGGMMLSPDARNDDGKLDVVTASGLSRGNVITELSRVHTGGHVDNPKVNITQAEIVRIETFMLKDGMRIEADGNVRGVTPVEFRVLPGALKFVVSDML